jgi:hypothetical protein
VVAAVVAAVVAVVLVVALHEITKRRQVGRCSGRPRPSQRGDDPL